MNPMCPQQHMHNERVWDIKHGFQLYSLIHTKCTDCVWLIHFILSQATWLVVAAAVREPTSLIVTILS